MHDVSSRAIPALIAAAAAATLFGAALTLTAPADLLIRYWQLTAAVVGASLSASVVLSRLRPPAVAAGLLSKFALLAAAAAAHGGGMRVEAIGADAVVVFVLSLAGFLLVREARREARWNGWVPVQRKT